METILIIDDEESIRTSLGLMFKREGFNVLTADDGKKEWRFLIKIRLILLLQIS